MSVARLAKQQMCADYTYELIGFVIHRMQRVLRFIE